MNSPFLIVLRKELRDALQNRLVLLLVAGLGAVAILSVIGSGIAFMTGMNMVGVAASEKSSSHPKGAKEKPLGPNSPKSESPDSEAPPDSPKSESPNSETPPDSPKSETPKDNAPAGSPSESMQLQHEANVITD